MFTQILVPLDGSKTAEAVLPYARMLSGNLKIPTQIISVIDTVAIGRQLGTEPYTKFDAVIKQQILNAEKYLSGVAKSFERENVRLTVETGAIAGTIISKAGEDKGTLIAMATHGRSGLKRWLLGSIAEKVLRAANNPLLLIRANEKASADGKAMLDSVTVPLDGSELAESVFLPVVELSKAMHLKLRLMRSYHMRGMAFNYEDYSGFGALVAQAKNEATSYLEAKVQELKAQGLMEVDSFTSEGEPRETILEAARDVPNCLIAMCTHGRSGVNRWVLGSVTEKVVRHADNPVLVVRAT